MQGLEPGVHDSFGSVLPNLCLDQGFPVLDFAFRLDALFWKLFPGHLPSTAHQGCGESSCYRDEESKMRRDEELCSVAHREVQQLS